MLKCNLQNKDMQDIKPYKKCNNFENKEPLAFLKDNIRIKFNVYTNNHATLHRVD